MGSHTLTLPFGTLFVVMKEYKRATCLIAFDWKQNFVSLW